MKGFLVVASLFCLALAGNVVGDQILAAQDEAIRQFSLDAKILYANDGAPVEGTAEVRLRMDQMDGTVVEVLLLNAPVTAGKLSGRVLVIKDLPAGVARVTMRLLDTAGRVLLKRSFTAQVVELPPEEDSGATLRLALEVADSSGTVLWRRELAREEGELIDFLDGIESLSFTLRVPRAP